jgi:hypothetical protein
MKVTSDRPAKRPVKDQGKTCSTKARVQAAEWELADQRLDEALRHTFPASDALSIIQMFVAASCMRVDAGARLSPPA